MLGNAHQGRQICAIDRLAFEEQFDALRDAWRAAQSLESRSARAFGSVTDGTDLGRRTPFTDHVFVVDLGLGSPDSHDPAQLLLRALNRPIQTKTPIMPKNGNRSRSTVPSDRTLGLVRVTCTLVGKRSGESALLSKE
jgi:hypothetical protein